MKMKKVRILLILMILMVLFISNVSASGLQFYIKMDGIQGVCKDPGHEGWIDALTFTHSSHESGRKGLLVDYYAFTHEVDNATPLIQDACAKQTVIPTTVCEVCKEKNGKMTPVYKVILKNSVVDSAIIGVGDEDAPVVENVKMKVQDAKFIVLDQDEYDKLLPETGDNAPLMLWALMAAGSFAVILFIRKRTAHSLG